MVASPVSSDSWFLDTRATDHLTNNVTHLSDVHLYHIPDQISIGNDKELHIHQAKQGSSCSQACHKSH